MSSTTGAGRRQDHAPDPDDRLLADPPDAIDELSSDPGTSMSWPSEARDTTRWSAVLSTVPLSYKVGRRESRARCAQLAPVRRVTRSTYSLRLSGLASVRGRLGGMPATGR